MSAFERSFWRYFSPFTRIGRRRSRLKMPRRVGAPSAATRYLAIATMVKNEASYLAEWLAFHRLQGVEHVYLYDNGSTDHTPTVIAPFIRAGFVTATPWPGDASTSTLQLQAYRHALIEHGSLYHWMAFIDVDEFLFPAAAPSLPALLERYEALPAVAVPWSMFGTSGHKTRPPGLVIESYTTRGTYLSRPKSIVQPSEVRGISNAHLLDFDEGRRVAYNERGQLIGKHGPFFSETFRLHHYYTRSEEELIAKRGGGRQRYAPRVAEELARMAESAVTDHLAARFAPAVRAELRRFDRHWSPSTTNENVASTLSNGLS